MVSKNQYSDLAMPNSYNNTYSDLAMPDNNESISSNTNFIKNLLSYLPKPDTSNPWLNITSGLASLGSQDPTMQKVLANLPEIATGQTPTKEQGIEQSIGRNIPSSFLPEAKGLGYTAETLSRILGQTGYGAATNPGNREKGGAEMGLTQAGLEIPGVLTKPISWLAEKVNPEKFAGKTAEQIRNLGQSGYDEAQQYYKPVNDKYNDNIVTTTPEDYLGFTPEERQWFKPETNKRYKDFLAEPNFQNLHMLQSSMGKQPELWMQRDVVKQKLASYLKQDPESLASYQKASDIMKNKYYPYVANDTLSDIVDTQKKITKFDPNKLSKAIEKSPIVDMSQKAAAPIDHPLVGLNDQLKNELQKGQAYQYGIPVALGAIAGHMIDPAIGGLAGGTSGALFGKFGEPQLLKLAQNPWIIKQLKNLDAMTKTGGRQAVGYNLYNQQ